MATHSSILAWRIPWTEEPGELYSPWSRKESDTTELLTHTHTHTHTHHVIKVNSPDATSLGAGEGVAVLQEKELQFSSVLLVQGRWRAWRWSLGWNVPRPGR